VWRGERELWRAVSDLPVGAVLEREDTPPFPPTGERSAVSCCAHAGGRCDASVEARHRGCAQRHQRVAQGLRWAGHGLDFACAGLALRGVETLLDRGTAMFEQAVDQPGELVGRCGEGFGGAQPAAHPSREGAQRRVRVLNRARGEAQGHGHALGAGAHAA
jgi:hypothetical protein